MNIERLLSSKVKVKSALSLSLFLIHIIFILNKEVSLDFDQLLLLAACAMVFPYLPWLLSVYL